MISVIVPVYNTEKYLDRCIQSILAQIYTDFELLLIDDGSTDSSGAICDKYAEQDLRVRVFHKENGGVSSARNMGLDNAKGIWVMFVDSDDWVNEDFCQRLVDISNSDLVLESGGDSFMESTISNTEIGFFLDSTESVLCWTVPWGKLYKRELIERNKLRFDINVFSGEDTMFVLEYLFCVNQISINHNCNYCYNFSGGLSLKKLSLKQLDYIIKQLLSRVELIEHKYGIELIKWKCNFVWNFITKYDIPNGIIEIYRDMGYILAQNYIKIIVEDRRVIPKGKSRRCFDMLFKYNMRWLLTGVCYFSRRFYY